MTTTDGAREIEGLIDFRRRMDLISTGVVP